VKSATSAHPGDKPFLDLRRWPLPGVQALDRHTLRLSVKGKAPQWNWWLALTFAAPVPWEADAFYAQPGMREQGLSQDRWPVGSGPYYMAEFVSDRRHEMRRNPLFRGETYPCDGAPGDAEAGLLQDCGKPLPFIDRVVAVMIKPSACRASSSSCKATWTCPRSSATTGAWSSAPTWNASAEVRQRLTARGLRFPQVVDGGRLVRGLQLAGPGGRPRRHARAAGAQSPAAPGAVDRHRLGRGLRPHLRPRGGGRPRAGAAGQLRLARRAARLAQPGHAPAGRRPGAAPPAGRGKGR
jgi:hypothetical protein